MSDLKFYNSPLSHNSLRVSMALAEKGQKDYEVIPIDFSKGEHKTPSMIDIGLWGKLPVLECPHAGSMYESRPIARYLAATLPGPTLIPTPTADPAAYAQFEMALAVEASKLDTDVSTLFFQVSIAPLHGMKTDEELCQKQIKNVKATLKVIDERILGKWKFMGGNEFSLADISFMPEFLALEVMGGDEAKIITEFPNVKRWWETVKARKSWKEVSPPVYRTYEGIMANIRPKA